MNVVVFNVSPWERAPFEALRSRGWEVRLFEQRLTSDAAVPEAAREADALSVFVNNPITPPVLDAFPRLRAVATRSTGFDHIDLEACRRRGVAVYHVPDYGSVTVAEYTLGLILALLRRFRPLIEQSAHGDFTRENLRGTDLAGRTVGVLGTGRIGREVVRRLAACAAHVLLYDVAPDESFARAAGARYVDLETLYRSCSVLTFHVPLRPETHHLFNRASLALLPWKTFLVNTSRGAVVETEAVIAGLLEERLAGAALDTFESEEVFMEERFHVADHLTQAELRRALTTYHLLRSDRVILSPHNAYNSDEALQRIVATTIANLEAFAGGRPTPNRIA